MYVHKDSTHYGFCPAKATWGDPEVVLLYNLLTVIAETGQLLEAGGIANQPTWLIDELAWFLPRYAMLKFGRQASMVFGGTDDTTKTAKTKGATPRKSQRGGRK